MKIQSSSISMASNSSLFISHSKSESLKMWTGDKRPDFEGRNRNLSLISPNKKGVTLELSEEAKRKLRELKTEKTEKDQGVDSEITDPDCQKARMIEKFIEALTGKKIKITIPKQVTSEQPGTNIQGAAPARAGWGLEYDYHESYYEKESMSFSAEGIIKTADGKEIDFSIQLNMSREFATRQDISVRAGDARKCDPLVINFGGAAPAFTDRKFSFDLDCDGASDQISSLSQNSGFLSLDLNNDGKINDGSELFGPRNGDGFADLARYDTDGNNWIDENDSIYDKLRIWTKDENGNDKLFALGEKGIGAIYLGNADTSFGMKDSNNNLQGQIQKTGIFVKENGEVGTVQHIDLAI